MSGYAYEEEREVWEGIAAQALAHQEATAAPTRIEQLRTIVADHQWAEIDGYPVDVTTAAMLVAVHDALNPYNQGCFGEIPFPRLVEFGWSQVK